MNSAHYAWNDWQMVAILNMALGVYSLYALDVIVSTARVHVVDHVGTHRVSITITVYVTK